MKKYFVQKSNKRTGPFELNQLMRMDIYADTLIWNEEMEDWKPASEITELKPVIKQNNDSNNPPRKNWLKYSFIVLSILILMLAIAILILNTENSSNNTSNESTQSSNETNVKTEPLEKHDAEAEELQRKKQEEARIEENKKYIRNNWSSYIKCSRSGYTAEGLGGISGLRVYFENKTGYFIESASAEIDIITANGNVYKTEYINITNLGGNNTYTFSVPYSPRGSRVSKPRITYIKSATMNFCYSPYGHDFVDSNDPYRCN
jgi:hypothetical protein